MAGIGGSASAPVTAGTEAPRSPAQDVVVSVVVPARNERDVIVPCLRALQNQTIGCGRLDVIVVAAGDDGTADIADACASGFARFEVLRLAAGNKNAALQAGCGRAHGDTIVLLDADTQLAPTAIDELHRAVAVDPVSAVHGAAAPRVDTWISRYGELNRRLVKDLRFDGNLRGEVVAMRRALLLGTDLARLFPEAVGAADDVWLGRALAERGYRIRYCAAARATTLVPWTLRGLVRSMLRNRRGGLAVVPFSDAVLQAGRSVLVVAALPAALVAVHWSGALALVCAFPLLVHLGVLSARVEALRRRGLGDHRTSLPAFLALDLLGRALKLWAFVERLTGRRAPESFRGERPDAGIAGAP